MLLLAACLLAGCQLLAAIGACWWISRLVSRKQRELEDRIRDLVTDWTVPPAEGKPHKLAELLSVVGAVVGQAAAHSIMASLNAEKSHLAKVANGLSDEIQGQQNPLIGLLAGGKRGKGAAVAQLMRLIGGGLAGGAPEQSRPGNGQTSFMDRLKQTH